MNTIIASRKVKRVDGKPAWRTRQGELLRMCDMTDEHVTNTLFYLRKRYEAFVFATINLAEEDDGACEDGAAEFMDSGPEVMTESYVRLLEEALRRGLKLDVDRIERPE